MKIGTLVRHEGLGEELGIVTHKVSEKIAMVFFMYLDETLSVFIEDLEAICE